MKLIGHSFFRIEPLISVLVNFFRIRIHIKIFFLFWFREFFGKMRGTTMLKKCYYKSDQKTISKHSFRLQNMFTIFGVDFNKMY